MANPIITRGMHSTEQSIYEVSTTQWHPLGTRALLDEKVFFYSRYEGSGTIGVGNLLMRPAPVSNHVSVAWASGGAADTKTVTVTLGATAATANQYQDGWCVVIDGTGSGQERKIKSHPAADSAATLEVTTYDAWNTSLASGAELSLHYNQYDNPRQYSVTAGDEKVVGVNPVALPAGNTNAQYYWAQTAGPALVVGDGSTFVAGGAVVPAVGTADAGQVSLIDDVEQTGTLNLHPVIGYLIDIGDATSDGDFRFVDLCIKS